MGLTTPTHGPEERDIHFWPLVLWAIVLVALIILVHLVSTRLQQHMAARASRYAVPSSVVETGQSFHGPHLLVNQSANMADLRASEDAVLHSYGWVNREQGIVHIPIERAMEVLEQRDRTGEKSR